MLTAYRSAHAQIHKLMTRRVARRQRGIDVFADIATRGLAFSPRLIMDVGANVGEISESMADRFPEATIHAFEPSRRNFEELKAVAARHPTVVPHQLAFGEGDGLVRFSDDNVDPKMSRISADGYDVKATAVDSFCRQENIGRVDYLKIDTEGNDLAVLKGARGLLSRREVAFVEVECGMNPENTFHCPFETMKSLLEQVDYRLFGIYEQMHEWLDKKPNLRRVNAVYMPKP